MYFDILISKGRIQDLEDMKFTQAQLEQAIRQKAKEVNYEHFT